MSDLITLNFKWISLNSHDIEVVKSTSDGRVLAWQDWRYFQGVWFAAESQRIGYGVITFYRFGSSSMISIWKKALPDGALALDLSGDGLLHRNLQPLSQHSASSKAPTNTTASQASEVRTSEEDSQLQWLPRKTKNRSNETEGTKGDWGPWLTLRVRN